MSSIGQFRDTLIPSTVHNARKLRFYEELWQHAEPERVRNVDDLSLLPVMDRVDYTERFHLFWTEEMLGRPFLVTHTSGTTGDPLYRYRSDEELDYIRRFFAAIHRSRGLSSRDRAVSVDTTNADAPHGGAIRIPHPGPLLHVPMDVPADIENAVEVLTRPHRVGGELRFVEELNMGMRQFVILTSFLAERGVDPKHALHVRRVRTSGGYLNAGAVRRISAFWDLFVGDQFSLSEIFGGAWKCSTCGWYHPDPFIAAEVVDYRTGDRIPQGVGVLVLTELYPFVQTHPFIRYWTGDVVETVATGCERSSLSFRYLGRTYARCGQTVRGPFRPQVKHALHGAILDEEGGSSCARARSWTSSGTRRESLAAASGPRWQIRSDSVGRGLPSNSSRVGLRSCGSGSRSTPRMRSTPHSSAVSTPFSSTATPRLQRGLNRSL